MRKPDKFGSLKRSCMQGSVMLLSIMMIQALCFLPSPQAGTGGEKEKGQKQSHADYERLAGKWVRPDGGYVLELKEIRKDGRLKASYFNPSPINVAQAEWRRMGDSLQVFIELRDVNYPGSTYTLIYSPENDRLIGTYFQAVEKQTFDIEFVRSK